MRRRHIGATIADYPLQVNCGKCLVLFLLKYYHENCVLDFIVQKCETYPFFPNIIRPKNVLSFKGLFVLPFIFY